jgi:anti-sigma regulatory factor (Ser/Thr protein kinase)
VAAPQQKQAFRHEAFFYAGQAEFLSGVAAFIRGGIAAGEPTLVLLPAAKIAQLRVELGEELPGLCFADIEGVARNPARLIPVWHDFVDEHLGTGVAMRGVGEPVRPGVDGDVLVESQNHETLLNLAFPDLLDFRLLCPYDTAGLEPAVLQAARAHHPEILEHGVHQESTAYHRPPMLGVLPGTPLPDPPCSAVEVRFRGHGLATVRALVADRARQLGMGTDRTADLVLSVNEIAANSVQYGGGSGTLRMWQQDGAMICEVQDRGVITDPLVGRRAPGTSPESSRGLWVVNQLCDLVQIRSTLEGTVVRLRMTLARHRSPG